MAQGIQIKPQLVPLKQPRQREGATFRCPSFSSLDQKERERIQESQLRFSYQPKSKAQQIDFLLRTAIDGVPRRHHHCYRGRSGGRVEGNLSSGARCGKERWSRVFDGERWRRRRKKGRRNVEMGETSEWTIRQW